MARVNAVALKVEASKVQRRPMNPRLSTASDSKDIDDEHATHLEEAINELSRESIGAGNNNN